MLNDWTEKMKMARVASAKRVSDASFHCSAILLRVETFVRLRLNSSENIRLPPTEG